MWNKKLSVYAPVVLRLSMAAVMAWFGGSQLFNASAWTGIVPAWALNLSHLTAITIVHLNGGLEILASLLLALGLWVRAVAGLLAIHLMVIMIDLGLNAVGVRDFGLSFSLLALAMWGNDEYCLVSPKNDSKVPRE